MPDARNVTGRWRGSYLQHDRPHPITAELVQEGERLTGSMRDDDTDRASGLFEYSSEVGLAPGADEQIDAKLRELFPDVRSGPIRFVTHLPPESSLEGRVRGANVTFLKVYRGAHFGGFEVGDHLVGHRIEGHAVHYGGVLSPDGREIEGRWWIDAVPGLSGSRTEGSFTLRRSGGGAGGRRRGGAQ